MEGGGNHGMEIVLEGVRWRIAGAIGAGVQQLPALERISFVRG